ncbi:MAG: hypothetical protein IT289_01705 [Oligoflexia bacterium]|nr:hypothetical protein [Oligoflexia bacterium]
MAHAQQSTRRPSCPEDVEVYVHTRLLCDRFNDYLNKPTAESWSAYFHFVRNIAYESYKNTKLTKWCHIDDATQKKTCDYVNPKLLATISNPWFDQAAFECFGTDQNKHFRFLFSMRAADVLGKEFIMLKVVAAATAVIRGGQIISGALALVKGSIGVTAYRILIGGAAAGSGAAGWKSYNDKKKELEKIADDPDATWLDVLKIDKNKLVRVKDENGCFMSVTLQEYMDSDNLTPVEQ